MRVLVLGAGIIGITTAWELLRDGHQVVLIDREAGPAQGTSHANAGLIVGGDTLAWGSPQRLRSLPRVWLGLDPSMRVGFPGPRMIRWGLRFLGQCSAAAWRRNTLLQHRLARYSQQVMADTVAESGVEYDRARGGLLYLFRDARSLDEADRAREVLREAGCTIEVLDAAQLVAREPALAAARVALAGALCCPTDESGDCRGFTERLAAECAARGADLRYGVTASGLRCDAGRVSAVATDHGDIEADAFVACLGCWSPMLARSLGDRLSIYPVKGLSLTFPVADAHRPPTLGGIDEDTHIAFSRIGERLRVTSMAIFGGYDDSHRPAQFARIIDGIRELFPEGADYAQPEYWAGLRPVTPDGAPILGRGSRRNLVYNAGHGSLGWTMACGSARIAADLVLQRSPAIDTASLGPH